MKLITHNLLMCNKKGCTVNNFPLKLIATKVEKYEEEALVEYSKPLMQRLAEKIDIDALRVTMEQQDPAVWQFDKEIKPLPSLETIQSENLLDNEDFLMQLHEVCCTRHVLEGQLQCNNCGR